MNLLSRDKHEIHPEHVAYLHYILCTGPAMIRIVCKYSSTGKLEKFTTHVNRDLHYVNLSLHVL